MKQRFWIISFVSILTILLTACSSGSSGGEGATSSDDQIVIKAGLVVGDWAPHYVALSTLKEVVEENSDTMKIELYPDGQLGGEREMLEGVQQGSLEFTAVSSSVFAAFDEKFTAIDIPYLVTNFDDAEKMIDGPVGEELASMFEEIGIKVIAWAHNDFRIISNSARPLHHPDDLNGIKMRVAESQVLTSWYTNLGALSTALPFPDIYNGLQQGVVDGQDNGPILTHASKFTEHQDYVTVTNHQYSPIGFFFNLDFWNTLTEEQQEVLQLAANEAAIAEREAIKEFRDMSLQEMENDGVEVIHLSDEELEPWVQTREEIIEDLKGKDNPLLDLVLEEVGW